MALAISGTPRRARIEQLLSSIEGVITVRVALDRSGDPVEIHVLSPPDLHAKQVVRNVISALTAGLGIDIDRRIISVAQLDPTVPPGNSPLGANGEAATASGGRAAKAADRPAAPADPHAAPANPDPAAPSAEDAPISADRPSAPGAEQHAAPTANRPLAPNSAENAAPKHTPAALNPAPAAEPKKGQAPTPSPGAPTQSPATRDSAHADHETFDGELVQAGAGRVVFSGYGTRQDKSRHVTCSVSVRHNGREYTGTGQGPDTPYGRAEASARATLQALTEARSLDDIAFEGIALVETHGRTYVHIAAHVIDAREPTPLVGTAAIKRTTEEAAILATLQAANRRAERIIPG